MTTNIERARTIASQLLDTTRAVSIDEISAAVDRASTLIPLIDSEKQLLARLIEAAVNVTVGVAGVLEDNRNHTPWLFDRRDQIDWRMWHRYKRFLLEQKRMPPQVVSRLDDVTDEVLQRLENPQRPGPWDRRGMVVGQVQSGKTANYSGLINKGIDAGYKVIVVLTGMDDSLRTQTQLRIDEGVIGFDSRRRMDMDQSNSRIGVGTVPGADFANVNCLTSSDQRGDFKKAVAQALGVNPSSDTPTVLVIKKNKRILENLIQWVTSFNAREDEHGIPVVYDTPLLVIDDECDFASVNTRPDDDNDPNAINGCVRKLLRSFEKKAYVGYTATPFANVFITPQSKAPEEFGEDLFPRNFIIHLKKSSEYVGATKIFGLDEDLSAGLEDIEGIPIIRHIHDNESWLSQTHKNYAPVAKDVPESLQDAILSFALVCAARRQRGQIREHNSMLVHVTRFVSVQKDVAVQLTEYVEQISQRLRHEDETDQGSVKHRMRQMWEGDFHRTSGAITEVENKWVEWGELVPHIWPAFEKISVRMINGESREALDYFEHSEGLSVIAVGGSKLSRGLTLEGLSVSYYLRTSKMYDTLMQMGRWFGYRPGYLDLCRLYTTPELVQWYEEVTKASEELLLQFDEMALTNGTPEDFGLRVRHSSLGLLITRAGAMRHTQKLKMSYSGSVTETINFDLSPESLSRNFDAAETLLEESRAMGSPFEDQGQKNVFLVSNKEVEKFLANFDAHEDNYRVITSLILKYIRSRSQDTPPELKRWRVVFVNGPQGEFTIAGQKMTASERNPVEPLSPTVYRIKRLVDPSHERIGLTSDQVSEALARTIRKFENGELKTKSGSEPKRPSNTILRSFRDPEEGLLLVYFIEHGTKPITGFAAVFPVSARGADLAVEYVVNNVQKFEEDDE